MNKSLLGLIIAAIVAIIGYLIYKFFFMKDSKNTNNAAGLAGAAAGAKAANPIASQDMNKVNTPAVTWPGIDKEFGGAASGSVLAVGFDTSKQESLMNGSALSQRTNNPGALFWDGIAQWQGMSKTGTKINQIIYFDTVDFGVRAQLMTLKNYSKLHGVKTLNEVTARYAPYGHGSNDPVRYAQVLSNYLGIDPNASFNLDSNRELLAALGYFMHNVEAGYFWLPRTKYSEWSTKV